MFASSVTALPHQVRAAAGAGGDAAPRRSRRRVRAARLPG
jgi:hypothetical protein